MSKVRILIVEDQMITATDIQGILIRFGYEVVGIVSSGKKAIEKAAKGKVDLVLMDIVLKGSMDGIEAAEQIWSRFDIPIVYLTAFADQNTLKRAMITEPYGYILKPFEERELQTNIEIALYKHRMERELRKSRQWYATTLNSIGDAVIATDTQGMVTFMNPVAERLTGWSNEDAIGCSLKEIFRIINEETRLPVELPVTKVLREESVVGLANHTVLVAKNGTEIPIDDSAAPIKDDKGVMLGVIMVFHDISKRRQDEKTINDALLKAENERIRAEAILEALGEGISIHDNDFRILYQNRAHKELLGSHEGEYCYKAYDGRKKICTVCPVDMAFKDGTIHSVERSITSDRGEIHLVITASVLRDVAGNMIAGIEVVRDITGLKQVEESLRASEERFRDLVESTSDWVWEIDKNSVYTYVSPNVYKILGCRADEMIGGTPFDFMSSKESSRVRTVFNDVTADRKPFTFLENINIHKDGHRVVLETSGVPFFDKSGEFSGYRGINRDITERKKTEMFIKNILDSVGDGFIVIGRDYEILSVNKAYCELVGKKEAELLGKPCYKISHHRSRPCFEEGEDCPVKHTFATGEPHSSLHIHKGKNDEEHHIDVRSYPMLDEGSSDVNQVIECIVDVTDEKRLEAQLRQAQKMEGIGLLAGGIAHDFNNILSVITGYGELIQMAVGDNDELAQSIGFILKASKRAAELTGSLLTFSRKQLISPKPVFLNEIVRRVERFIVRLISEEIKLTLKLSDEDITVMADSSQIEQILINFVTNARDAMPEGGLLHFETDTIIFDEAHIGSYGYGRPGRYGVFSITDTGTGMDEKTKERIFEPFFTTKGEGKGTGLGLSVVYGIVKQHNGFINVYSEVGKGTTIKVYIPLIEQEEKEKTDWKPDVLPKGTETILVAEDNAEVRSITREILKIHGYTVIEAHDGEEALEKLGNLSQQIQLLILDVIMPKKNGKEVYNEAQKINPDIKTIFMSGYTADIIHKKGILEKGLHFIQKPFLRSDLLRKVREVLDS